ncbi:MAG: DUF3592 domain-containing protein [Clostridiales bacterium]|nr:DUF3592 domain-containing protein [Candidatus Scatonaster coprocaballi]
MHYSKEGKYFRETDVRPNMHDFNAYLREKGRREFQESPRSARNIITLILILATILSVVLLVVSACTKNLSNACHILLIICALISLIVFVNSKRKDPEAPKINLPQIISGICFLLAVGSEVCYLLYRLDYIKNPAGKVLALVSVLLGIAGVVTIVATCVRFFYLRKHCTVALQATCIGFDDVIRTVGSENSQTSYLETCPVYAFTYGGHTYTVYDGYYEEDEVDLPRIGDGAEVKVNPENPNQCIVNGRNTLRLGVLIAGVCIIAAGLILYAVSMAVKKDMDTGEGTGKNTRREINDALIISTYGLPTDEVPEYLVFERVVIAVDGNKYYFEEVPGLPSTISSSSKYEVNERVYWVDVSGEKDMICDMDDYYYSGDKTPENSSRYSKDGKCYITDRYVKERYDSDTYYWMKLEDGQVDLLDTQMYIYKE